MASLYERDQKAISKLSFLRFFPQAVVGGDGAFLIGDDGRRLLDFSASWGAASLGHSHPAVRKAVVQAMESQAGASYLSSANLPAVELAEKAMIEPSWFDKLTVGAYQWPRAEPVEGRSRFTKEQSCDTPSSAIT